jgi:tetratricopeptide (TPR) repeat protein
MSAPPDAPREPVRRRTRPQRWQWVLAATIAGGSVIGGIASNILADLVDRDLGAVTWVVAGVAVLAVGMLAMLEVIGRRPLVIDPGVEPLPAVPVQEAGVTADLPYTTGFVGRQGVVDWLVDAVRTDHAVALVGRRAVGTSACVVQAANVVRGDYLAALYLDLRRTDARGSGHALRPHEILDALCRKVGVDAATLDRSPGLDATAALLRTHIGDRKVLLVLDNVDTPDQVRLLLPPAAHSRLLMAGGPALDELEGVRVRQLTEPSGAEAMALFTAAAGRAGSPYPGLVTEAVAELVELAGRQPHAVRLLGSWMARQTWSPLDLLDAVRRESAPGQADATVTLLASRDRAYAALTGGTRRLIRLLALVGQPLSRDAIAALIGTSRGRADAMLGEAAAAAFVTATPDGRYRLRALLVRYARVHLQCEESPHRRVAAEARLVRHLAGQAERYADAVLPDAPSSAEAGAWFGRTEDLLHTLVCEPFGRPGAMPARPSRRIRQWWLRLAVALCTWYAAAGRLDDWASVCRAVLDSPLAGRGTAAAGWAHNELGAVLRWQGLRHEATIELTTAVRLRHRRGAAQSRTNLGLALLDLGNVGGALEQLLRARSQRSPRDRAGQAFTDLGLGAAYLAHDDPGTARHFLILAANRFESIGDRRGYAAALANLALAQWWLGERLDAAHAWNAALKHHPAVNDPRGHAATLLNAGAIMLGGAGHRDRQRASRARELLEESLRVRQNNDGLLGRTLLYLGDAADVLGETDEARRCWDAAAKECDDVKDAAGAEAARARAPGVTRTEP